MRSISKPNRLCIRLIGVLTVLLSSCGQGSAPGTTFAWQTSTVAPTITATAIPSVLPSPPSTSEPTAVVPDSTDVTPVTTAPYIHFASWSPDSHWIAYWLSSQEDVDNQIPYTMPGGTLHLLNVETDQSCIVPQFVTPDDSVAEVY